MKNETISKASKPWSIPLINALDIVRNGNCHFLFQNAQLTPEKGMLTRPQYVCIPGFPCFDDIIPSAVGLTVFASIIFQSKESFRYRMKIPVSFLKRK